MTYKIWFVALLVISVVLSTQVHAFSNTSGITHAWSFDDGNTTHAPDLVLTDPHNIEYDTEIGIIDSAWDSKGIYYSNTDANASLPDAELGLPWAMSIHYYANSSIQDNSGFYYQGDRGDGVRSRRILYYTATGWNIQNFKTPSGYNCNVQTGAITQDKWTHFMIIVNSTGCIYYIDGVGTWTASATANTDLDGGAYGNMGTGDQAASKGLQIDDFAIIEGWQPTDADVQELNTTTLSSILGPAPPPSNSSPPFEVLSTSPADDTQFNTLTFTINATTNSSAPGNISLYLDGVLNQTVLNVPAGNSTNTTFNFTFAENFNHTFTYFVRIGNGTNESNSSTNTFYIDNVAPTISWGFPTTANDSSTSNFLVTNVTVSDVFNLYSYYYNISWPNGSVIYNVSNTSMADAGLKTFTITDRVNVTGYNGPLLATTTVCDGHTAKEIKFKDNKKENDELKFDTNNHNVRVYLETKSKTKEYDYEKKHDRYIFKFKTKDAAVQEKFIVESDVYIDILNGKTSYKGHLVIGNKWVDFENEDVVSVDVERINQKKVRVVVNYAYPTDTWEFNSIGELNCLTETTQFFSATTSTAFTTPVLEGSLNTYYLNVTYNGSFVGSAITANLIYNGTSYVATGVNHTDHYAFSVEIVTPTLDTDQNLTLDWNYTIDSVSYNTTDENQEAYQFFLSNCTVYSNRALNYTIKDEDNSSLIRGTVSTSITYTVGNLSKTFNESRTNTSNFAYCVSPSIFNASASITIQYDATGYGARSYIQTNYTIDTTEDFVDLLLALSSTTSAITFHVINPSDEDLEGIVIEAYRYDVSTSSDVLTDTATTDSQGNVIFRLDTNSEQYSFKFYRDSVLVLETIRFQMFSSTYEYVIGVSQVSRLNENRKIRTYLDSTLTYTNSSQVVDFTWTYTGDLVSEFCLNITDSNTTYYANCSSTIASDTLSYTISTLNVSYYAVATAVTSTGNKYVLHTLNVDTRTGWRTFGLDNGVVFAIFLILVVVLLALVTRNPSIVIVSTGLSVFLVSLFGVTPLSKATGIGAVALSIVLVLVINKSGGGA